MHRYALWAAAGICVLTLLPQVIGGHENRRARQKIVRLMVFDTSESFQLWLGAAAEAAVHAALERDPGTSLLNCFRFDTNMREFHRDAPPATATALRILFASNLAVNQATDGTHPEVAFRLLARRYAQYDRPFVITVWSDGENSDHRPASRQRLAADIRALARNPNCKGIELLGLEPRFFGYWSDLLEPFGESRIHISTNLKPGPATFPLAGTGHEIAR